MAVVILPRMTIEHGWICVGLGRFRDIGFHTYIGGSYDDLPALPDTYPGGLHAWMRDLVPLGALADEDGLETLGGEVPTDGHVAKLPAEFVTFLADPLLRDSVPTCTACYWEESLPVAPSPVHESAQLVRFLNDQQGCVFWYLHLLPDGTHEILSGQYAYDMEEVPPGHAEADLLRVAGGFDEFIARFWIENLAWYEVVGQDRSDENLSGPVREYVRQLSA